MRALQRGFTFIGVLLAVAILGASLAYLGVVWETAARREREAQLLFVGEQYRRAIGSYFESSPGAAKRYPARLEDLLDDKRYPTVKRHLRRLYRDPMTRSGEWGMVREGERITGVYSLSRDAPLKKANFARDGEAFAAASSYTGWRFVYIPGAVAGAAGAGGSGAAAGGAGGSASAAVAPGGAAPETPPIAATASSPLTPRAEPDQKFCDQVKRQDDGVCRVLRVQKIDESAARCEAQAQARYAACLAGESLPAFNLGRSE